MNSRVVVLVVLIVIAVTAGLFVHHRYVVADQVAARLTRAVDKNPQFAGFATVHHAGPQVSVWVADTLPAASRDQLERVVADSGRPLRVKLVELHMIDSPARDTQY